MGENADAADSPHDKAEAAVSEVRDAAVTVCLEALCALPNADEGYAALRNIVFNMFMSCEGWRPCWPAFVDGMQDAFEKAVVLHSEPAGHA